MIKHPYFNYEDLQDTTHFRKLETKKLATNRIEECYEVIEATEYANKKLGNEKKYDINDKDEFVKIMIKAVKLYDELGNKNALNLTTFEGPYSKEALIQLFYDYTDLEIKTKDLRTKYVLKKRDKADLMHWLDLIAYELDYLVPHCGEMDRLWLITTEYRKSLFTIALDYSSSKHLIYDIFITANYFELINKLRAKFPNPDKWWGTICINYSSELLGELKKAFPRASVIYDLQQIPTALDNFFKLAQNRPCKYKISLLQDNIMTGFREFIEDRNSSKMVTCIKNNLYELSQLCTHDIFKSDPILINEITNFIEYTKYLHNSLYAMLGESNIWDAGYLEHALINETINKKLHKHDKSQKAISVLSPERLRLILLTNYQVPNEKKVKQNYRLRGSVKSLLSFRYKCASGDIPNERSIYLPRYKTHILRVFKVVRPPKIADLPTDINTLYKRFEYIQSKLETK